MISDKSLTPITLTHLQKFMNYQYIMEVVKDRKMIMINANIFKNRLIINE